MKKFKKCRPPKGAYEVERWTGRRWIPDDGRPGYCFSGMIAFVTDNGFSSAYPGAWYVDDARDDMLFRALRRTCERFRAANGRPVPEAWEAEEAQ